MLTLARASATVALGLAAATGAWGEGFFNLGPNNAVSGLSADGSVAAGTNFDEYFIWSANAGLTGIGGQVPGGGIGGQARISDDGTRVSGTTFNAATGFFEMSYYDVTSSTWTPLGGIGAFCPGGPGDETSSGWGISNDGTSVVGLGWFDFCGPAHAIQWTESSGMTSDLGSTVMDRSSRANGVNADGSVVVGWQDRMDGFRQGAVWDGGVQTIVETPSGDPASEAQDVDAAGEWVVGLGGFATADEAWRWSAATGLEQLGMDCPGCFLPRGFATGISNDGSVIVGFNREFPFGRTVPFVWTEATGMVNLNDFIAAQGIDTGGFDLTQPFTISGDGRSIGGIGTPPGGFFPSDGFVVTLPAPDAAAQLDIKPGSCPNAFNPKSRGVLPVALLGREDFDVTTVDLASLAIAGVAPIAGPRGPHPVFDDVAAPSSATGCDCEVTMPDGITDLVLKFRVPELVEALDLTGADPIELCLTGTRLDGTPFEACDCIVLVPVGGSSPLALDD
jgi:uncharacterized membrane protein